MREKNPEKQDANQPVVSSNAATVILFIVIALGVVGYLIGIRHASRVQQDEHPVRQALKYIKQQPQVSQVQLARMYREIRDGNLGPNADWITVVEPHLMTAANVAPTDDPEYGGDKTQALAKREARRAYNGAPPTIPHAIPSTSVQACSVCHGENGQSLRIGNQVIAPPMPHKKYTSCTQCHVPQNPVREDEQRWLENSFVGVATPKEGDRAYPGAPPTIPHSVWMRESCMSCHGPNGQSALRSGHVWRTNCLQCHGQSATLNQFAGENQFIEPNFKLPAADE